MDTANDVFDEIAAFFDPDILAACRVDPARPAAEPVATSAGLEPVPAPEYHITAAQHAAPPSAVSPYAFNYEPLLEPGPFALYSPAGEPPAEIPAAQCYDCAVCSKQHASRADLVRHMRFHTGERPYKCQGCDKTFAQKGDLKVHARAHTGETPFRCRQCGKQFAQFTGLKYHERTHSGERPVQCPECGRAFVHKGDLNVHMRTHTGEKPFACMVCHKRFTQRGSVRVHMRRKHNQIVTKVPRTPDPALAARPAEQSN